jgi:hypothetical protein
MLIGPTALQHDVNPEARAKCTPCSRVLVSGCCGTKKQAGHDRHATMPSTVR